MIIFILFSIFVVAIPIHSTQSVRIAVYIIYVANAILTTI